MDDNEWPSVQLERGGRTIWISHEEDALVRYDSDPDLHLARMAPSPGRARLYRTEDGGTTTVAKVVGHVEVSPGDRLSYRTLTRPEDPDSWLSIESWDSGWVEISVGRTWATNRVVHRR